MLGSNHGGGYLYSLCPAAEALTEECFQMGSLPFVGHSHTIRYLDNKTSGQQNRTELTIPATDVSVGTWPKGSSWRLNPIPACNCDRGDSCVAQNTTDIDLLKACKDPDTSQFRSFPFFSSPPQSSSTEPASPTPSRRPRWHRFLGICKRALPTSARRPRGAPFGSLACAPPAVAVAPAQTPTKALRSPKARPAMGMIARLARSFRCPFHTATACICGTTRKTGPPATCGPLWTRSKSRTPPASSCCAGAGYVGSRMHAGTHADSTALTLTWPMFTLPADAHLCRSPPSPAPHIVHRCRSPPLPVACRPPCVSQRQNQDTEQNPQIWTHCADVSIVA